MLAKSKCTILESGPLTIFYGNIFIIFLVVFFFFKKKNTIQYFFVAGLIKFVQDTLLPQLVEKAPFGSDLDIRVISGIS